MFVFLKMQVAGPEFADSLHFGPIQRVRAYPVRQGSSTTSRSSDRESLR
jgi:hypothetical protein